MFATLPNFVYIENFAYTAKKKKKHNKWVTKQNKILHQGYQNVYYWKWKGNGRTRKDKILKKISGPERKMVHWERKKQVYIIGKDYRGYKCKTTELHVHLTKMSESRLTQKIKYIIKVQATTKLVKETTKDIVKIKINPNNIWKRGVSN